MARTTGIYARYKKNNIMVNSLYLSFSFRGNINLFKTWMKAAYGSLITYLAFSVTLAKYFSTKNIATVYTLRVFRMKIIQLASSSKIGLHLYTNTAVIQLWFVTSFIRDKINYIVAIREIRRKSFAHMREKKQRRFPLSSR